jgi:hypothetical protein
MTERQFTPPWSVQELEACFIVKDGAVHLAAIMVRKFCENLIEPYRSPRDCASLRKGYGC